MTDEAATATPGQTDNATSPAASHNLFPVPRMLGSLVIANLVSVVNLDAAFRDPRMGRLYTGHAVRATPALFRVHWAVPSLLDSIRQGGVYRGCSSAILVVVSTRCSMSRLLPCTFDRTMLRRKPLSERVRARLTVTR